MATDVAVQVVWCGLYGAGGCFICRLLARHAMAHAFQLATGAIFMCFSLVLAEAEMRSPLLRQGEGKLSSQANYYLRS